MRIRFTKGREKPGTMVCLREDGTQTWAALSYNFAQHDLAHYVVETTLGLRSSFYGLVADGVDIPDFGLAKERRPFEIPQEAVQTEHIVSQLQVEIADGALMEDFHATLVDACRQLGHGTPRAITPEELGRLRAGIRDLWQRWQALPPGRVIELEYPGR